MQHIHDEFHMIARSLQSWAAKVERRELRRLQPCPCADAAALGTFAIACVLVVWRAWETLGAIRFR